MGNNEPVYFVDFTYRIGKLAVSTPHLRVCADKYAKIVRVYYYRAPLYLLAICIGSKQNGETKGFMF